MPGDLVIQSLRGGQNDTDLPHLLEDDQCQSATNVEFYYSALGERRLGCVPYDLTGSGLTAQDIIVHGAERFPNNDINNPEKWLIAFDVPDDFGVVASQYQGVWTAVTPKDPILGLIPDIFQIRSQQLDGKLFIAYASGVDRLHVVDRMGVFRRTGLAQPAAPVVTDEGADAFVTTRYYRVRYIEKSGTVILRRSEPSNTTTFNPSGAGMGAHIARPALISEGETHWEVEASADNANFFRIQTVAVSVMSYNDETNLAMAQYNTLGPASEPIGNYLLQPSARFIIADEDRLIMAGHWTDVDKKSRVSWTPVFADPGVGNDERLPLSSNGDNFEDLDNYDGGELTGLGQVSVGTWYAFKWSRIYKMTRTGDVNRAYRSLCLSKTRGALPNSIIQGVDETGKPCIYFIDPFMGPCSVGLAGVRDVVGLRRTWKRFTYDKNSIACHGVYYSDKQQLHWWLAADGNLFPTLKLILQTNYLRPAQGGVAGCWTLATGKIATGYCSWIWHELTQENGSTRIRARPFIGLPSPDLVQRCDAGDNDNGVEFLASVTSKPYLLAGLQDYWGARRASILATAHAGSIAVSTIRDFGLEQQNFTTDLTPVGSEPFVIRQLDNLQMSESYAIQLQWGDIAP